MLKSDILTFVVIEWTDGTLTTITSSYEINQQRFACMGEAIVVTCTINDTAECVHLSVNGRVFLFNNVVEVFTGDGASVALLSNTNGVRVLSAIITNVSEMIYNLTCNLDNYTVQASGM